MRAQQDAKQPHSILSKGKQTLEARTNCKHTTDRKRTSTGKNLARPICLSTVGETNRLRVNPARGHLVHYSWAIAGLELLAQAVELLVRHDRIALRPSEPPRLSQNDESSSCCHNPKRLPMKVHRILSTHHHTHATARDNGLEEGSVVADIQKRALPWRRNTF